MLTAKAENSLNDQVDEVREAFYRMMENAYSPMPSMVPMHYVEDIFSDYMIAEIEDKYFKIGYSKDAGGKIGFDVRQSWAEMEESWKPATAKSADMLVSIGDAVKVISEDAQGIRITGVLARYTDPEHPDKSATRDYFDRETFFGLKPGERKSTPLYFHHGQALKTADGKSVKIEDEIGEAEIYLGDAGVLVDAIVYQRNQYEKALGAHVKMMGFSSGAINHVVKREPVGGANHIKRWIIGETSITPTPAEPLNSVISLKSISPVIPLNLSELQAEKQPAEAAKTAQATPGALAKNQPAKENKMEYTPEEITDLLDRAAEKAVKSFVAATPATNAGGLSVTKDEADRPFLTIAEQCKAIKDFTVSMGRVIDPRLQRIENAMKAALGANEQSPTEGGLLLDPTLVSEVITPIHQEGPFSPRVRRMPVGNNSNSGWINGIDETSRATGSRWGGIRGYRLAEAGSLTASKPKFRRINWELKKYGALVYSTDELLRDASQFSAIVNTGVREEIGFMLNDDIFSGIGVAGAQGVMNSPALVTVTRDTGSKILHADIVAMWQRLDARSKANAAWYINSECQPQLDALYFSGTTSVLSPYVSYGVDGVMRIYGKPVIETEFNSALNTTGDILLADMSQYLMWEKQGIQEATSIHIAFLTDETAFRFIYASDGQSSLNSPLTPYKGTLTKSPFVVLGSAT